MFLPFDRNLPLIHRFQQRGLRARRGPVDLVRQKQVRENRTFAKEKRAFLRRINGGAEDVGWQQIGGELNPAEIRGNGQRKRLCQCGFPRPGDILHQDMPLREESAEQQTHDILLAADDAIELFLHFQHFSVKFPVRHRHPPFHRAFSAI